MRKRRQAAGWISILAALFVLGLGLLGHPCPAGADANDRSRLDSLRARAEQGEAAAQVELGGIYHDGRGVAPDSKEALIWYTKAALQGDAAAQQNLGVMYAQGQGVARNYLYSYAWSDLAAEQGQAGAARNRDGAARHLSRLQLLQARELTAKLRAKVGLSPATPGPRAGTSPPSLPTAPQTRGAVPRSPRGTDLHLKSTGTGFIISKDGYLLTCHHVIAGGRAITVKVGQDQYPARVIRDDPRNDLALLKINGTFQALAFAGPGSATLGQEVFTIGYPDPVLQGVSAKFTKGEISSLAGIRDDARFYQISVPVQPGNSGGPLLDLDGNVTGVIVAMLDAKTAFALSGSLPQSVNYAVKGSLARALLSGLPAVIDSLPPPVGGEPFTQVVERASQAAVMVLVHE